MATSSKEQEGAGSHNTSFLSDLLQKFPSAFPSFQQFIPIPFRILFLYVRNRREAELLLRIKEAISCLDLLMDQLRKCVDQMVLLSPALLSISSLSSCSSLVHAVSILQSVEKQEKLTISMLERELRSCITALSQYGEELNTFCETNRILEKEFRLFSCEDLANMKSTLYVGIVRDF